MGQAMHDNEPPSFAGRFTVGHDADGRWMVCDKEGLVGGVFADKASALHFARFESDRIPGAVCCAPDEAVLDLDPARMPASHGSIGAPGG